MGLFKIFCWVVASAFLFEPAWFWYVALRLPQDTARVFTYCLVAAPLSAFPLIYSKTLGLGRESSFFIRATRSINKLRAFGGAFSLLALLAISVSRLSPFQSVPPHGLVSAPAFPNAANAPNVTGVSLPFLGNWAPFGANAGEGIVHSLNDKHSALLNQSSSNTNCSSISEDSEITMAFKAASQSISSLPLAVATVDSGCSASCTHDCKLLINTRPCDELFGMASSLAPR